VDVDVGELRHDGVAGIHAAHMRAERDLVAALIGGIGEIVVAQRVCPESRVVLRGGERQRCTAAPPAYQLRREQLPLLLGFRVLA
jgi:hypothetical protein